MQEKAETMYDKVKFMFNIKNVINMLKEKRNSNDNIFFQTALPHIDGINEQDIKIVFGSSEPQTTISFFFLTYAILHEFEQIYNKQSIEDIQTRDYFFQDIIVKSEDSIKEIKDYFLKQDNKQNINIFDYSHKDFFVSKELQVYKKGSEMKNNTYCYNNNKISARILNPLLFDKMTGQTTFLIKLPSVISFAVSDLLKLLSFSFNKILLFKATEDSFLKDSFYVYCSEPNIQNYKNVKSWIEKSLKNNKQDSENLENLRINKILTREKDDYHPDFNLRQRLFALTLETLIFTMFYNLIISYNTDIKVATRRTETWEMLDYYNKGG